MNIKPLRKARHLTQQQLADRLNVSRTTLTMWEIGKAKPSVDHLVSMADILGCTTDELLGRGTMDNIRTTILRAAIDHYGKGPQRFKAIEELSELIRALARCDDRENIAEEMADVRIMLDQLELILGNHDKVREYEYQKLKRLSDRLHAADTVG